MEIRHKNEAYSSQTVMFVSCPVDIATQVMCLRSMHYSSRKREMQVVYDISTAKARYHTNSLIYLPLYFSDTHTQAGDTTI